MTPSKATVSRLLASALAVAALFTFATGLLCAQVILRVPGDSPGIPLYTRTDPPFLFHTEQWAAIVFYRKPDCVPSNVNLLQFPQPGAFACELTVSGFELWADGPAVDAGPRQAVSTGGAVPVWFVSWPALEAALADNVLTKSELESLGPLKGIATNYVEVLHPFVPPEMTGGAKIPHLTITASGVLPDGRWFQCEFTAGGANGKVNHVRIVIR